MTIPTNKEKLGCMERELTLRRAMYPRWVKQGKMSVAQCVHQIRCMEAVVEDYRNLVSQDERTEAVL